MGIVLSLDPTNVLAEDSTLIILDGSGSMWGQIDGQPKLSIARDTLREVVALVPPTNRLGLMAYGHRRKGDCSDIELLVPPAAGTGAQIVSNADSMLFLGKTPLSDAVSLAAKEMNHTEDKATIVLVTDGLETCGGDPCALAEALEQSGVDFTIHVVGFGLGKDEEAQVSCLAMKTGGTFLSASNATELTTALAQTVPVEAPVVEEAPPAIEAPPVIEKPPEIENEVGFYLYAFDEAGVQIENTVDWNFYDLETGALIESTRGFFLVGSLPADQYRVVATYANLEGELEFDLVDAGFPTFNVTLKAK